MSGTTRPLTRLAAVLSAASMAVFTASLPASGHGDDHHMEQAHEARQQFLAAPSGPSLTSDNVTFLANFPETQAISGTFSRATEHFYVSSLDSISVFDVSEPASPTLEGTLPIANFENEAMNYGQQRRDGKLRQFVLVGVDIYAASTDDPQHVNVGEGNELILVDVTNPNNPQIRSRVKNVTSSTHTVACVSATNCNFAYSAGGRGSYSIIDLRNWNEPKEVDSNARMKGIQGFRSPALNASPVFTRGAGHKWNFVGRNLAVHTGSGGSAVFNISRPLKPRLLTTTTKAGEVAPLNDFIHHNSWQPHTLRYENGRRPALRNGNVLLITEEDYEQTDCSKAGSFQTWHLKSLRRDNAIVPLDHVELTDLGGPAQGITPQGAFCSAHWFDYHQTGIVAAAYYNGGVRFLDVRDPSNIKSFGFAQGGGETWDAYWVPQRNRKGTHLLTRTNIVYSVDLVRGLDVYRVDVPNKSVIAPAAASMRVASIAPVWV